MAEGKRVGSELLDEDYDDAEITMPSGASMEDTPFNQAKDILTKTSGPELEIMCRSTKSVVEASQVTYAMDYGFHSGYLRGRMDQILRFTISADGKGRGEIVDLQKAGSGVPPEFFETQAGPSAGFSTE